MLEGCWIKHIRFKEYYYMAGSASGHDEVNPVS